MLLSIDGTLLIQLANFIIFLVILNAVYFRHVGAALAKRRAYIDGLSHDIESLQGDVKALNDQADGKRTAARRAGDEAIAAARAQSSAEAERLSAEAIAKAQSLVDAAHKQVAAETAQARENEPALGAALSATMLERAFPGSAV
jgi:F-type H+-transporting ATPase subunit b